jgi:hypothetical protein
MNADEVSVLVATENDVVVIDATQGTSSVGRRFGARPTCLAADPFHAERAWCGTHQDGVFRSDDGGISWRLLGLYGKRIMSVAASPAAPGFVWTGTEPSQVWRSADGGESWQQTSSLEVLPSSPTWSFPPKPDTHHVRWIACHPQNGERIWVAIEAGALLSTIDGGNSWIDRVPDGPWDTHELALHRMKPDTLRVSGGDGYFESDDSGATWLSPTEGLDVGYLRSVAMDPGNPDVVVVSASTGPYTAYAANQSDGRLYRREGNGRWERIRDGWPEKPSTIAPLLAPGVRAGEIWAADERGVHRSQNSGVSWQRIAEYPRAPLYLRGLVVLATS